MESVDSTLSTLSQYALKYPCSSLAGVDDSLGLCGKVVKAGEKRPTALAFVRSFHKFPLSIDANPSWHQGGTTDGMAEAISDGR